MGIQLVLLIIAQALETPKKFGQLRGEHWPTIDQEKVLADFPKVIRR